VTSRAALYCVYRNVGIAGETGYLDKYLAYFPRGEFKHLSSTIIKCESLQTARAISFMVTLSITFNTDETFNYAI
jgi:hypothetical protein